jgi:hypothetical protein
MRTYSRRGFIKSGTVGGLAIVISPALLFTSGCSVDVKALLNTVIESAEAVIAVAEAGASWVTPLENAIAALIGAEQQWEGGSPIAIIESALETVEDVLAVIPLTAVYSPLVAVIVAAIDAILNVWAPVSLKATAVANPYHGMVSFKPSFAHPTWQGAYKALFNRTAVRLGLTKAVIK